LHFGVEFGIAHRPAWRAAAVPDVLALLRAVSKVQRQGCRLDRRLRIFVEDNLCAQRAHSRVGDAIVLVLSASVSGAKRARNSRQASITGLPVGLMWGVGPVTKARLAKVGVLTIGQLAKTPGWSLVRLLGPAAGEKLAALAWNRDPREIKTHRRTQSAGAQSAIGRKPAEERVFRPTLLHLADRIGTRLRAKSKPGRTVTVRVRFANMGSASRSVTLDAPISATVILAEIAEDLVRAVLVDHPDEKTISLLALSVSHLEEHWDVQLELPLGLRDEARRPGTKKGMARWAADCAVDKIRDRFGWDAIGYASVAPGISRSVPDEFRKLAEKDL
jgi:DNA polymerase-4